MKKTTAFFAPFLIAIHLVDAQAPLSLNLSFEKDTLDFISPWSFSLEISNTSDTSIFTYPLLISSGYVVEYGEILLEKKYERDSIWEKTKLIINNHAERFSSVESYRTMLRPHQRVKSQFFCLPPLKSNNPGRTAVRVSYARLSDSKRIISPPVSIYISEYHGDDSVAFNYLKKQPRPDFLLFPLFSMSGVDTSDIARAEYLIKEFPKSSFCSYAMLYLNFMYAQKAQSIVSKPKDRDDMIKYLRLSKKYGLSVFENKNLKMQEIATNTLTGLELILFSLYDSSPPLDLEEEFTFPFKR